MLTIRTIGIQIEPLFAVKLVKLVVKLHLRARSRWWCISSDTAGAGAASSFASLLWLEPHGLPAAANSPARSAFARLGSTGWPCALALLVATALGCRAGPHGGTSCTVATTAVNRGAFERNNGSSATACTASLAALS